jgi:hypothetical protein
VSRQVIGNVISSWAETNLGSRGVKFRSVVASPDSLVERRPIEAKRSLPPFRQKGLFETCPSRKREAKVGNSKQGAEVALQRQRWGIEKHLAASNVSNAEVLSANRL